MRKFVLLLTLLLIAVQLYAGAPLKGVDVKLGRSPGGSPAARTQTTDDHGHFAFSVVEKGTYEITLSPPANVKGAPETCLVEINGQKTPYHFKAAATGKAAPSKIIVISDGKNAISGTVWK